MKSVSRRQFLRSTSAAVAATGWASGLPALALPVAARDTPPDAQPSSATAGVIADRSPGHFAPFHRPPDIPAIKFMKDKVPAVRVIEVTGKSAPALVPDTCDVEEHARIFIEHYLNSITVPELMHEPFNRGRLNAVPPRLSLDTGSYDCALPKFRESLPLLRMMTGSTAGLEIDRTWAQLTLHCIAPDGLFYDPRIGRPWDRVGAYPWVPQNADYRCALYTGNGRLLDSLTTYYKMTGDEVWNQTARGVVDGLNRLAIRVDNMSFFPRYDFAYGYKPSAEEIEKAVANLRSEHFDDTAWKDMAGETELNNALWQTWIITGLAQYYRVSGYEPAKDLAYRLVNYLRRLQYVEGWRSHFHCITLAIHGMLELATSTGDQELAQYAKAGYDAARSGEKTIALPEIGFFTNAQVTYGGIPAGMPVPSRGAQPMEGCSIGDMTSLAAKLVHLNMGDQYWEDVDRYTRNALTAIQRTHPEHSEVIFRKLQDKGWGQNTPVQYYELTDRLAERLVGSFSTFSMPSDLYGGRPDFDTCCNGNCSRALYYVWENMITAKNTDVNVNLLLNRTSPQLDISSYIPYTGHVEFNVKKPAASLRVRMNNWIVKEDVSVRVNDAPRAARWDGNRLIVADVKPGQKVTLDFPISERVQNISSWDHHFQATIRGNDVVDLNPKGEFYPLYQREHYRTGEPRFRKTTRFVADRTMNA